MAKMTQARTNRWKANVQKARELLQATAADVGNAKLAAKDDEVYSAVMDTGRKLVPLLNGLDELASDDERVSPVHRVRDIVATQAQERKAVAARKATENGVATL